ncbi:MAG: hypothetical protein ACRCZG_02225, partial [Culicoidibacterales bacterium]
MSETLNGKLQQSWPMLIGGKNTKFRQELLAMYEQEQEQQQQHVKDEQAKAEALRSEITKLEA